MSEFEPARDSEAAGAGMTVTIVINGGTYRVERKPMTGAALREVAAPPIGRDYEFIQVRKDGADLLIREDEIVELAEGTEFIAVPRRILAGKQGTCRGEAL
jgi:hypothetical protein